MAKRKPTLSLEQMEKEMGYGLDIVSRIDEVVNRFYSDLKPVADSKYGRTKREHADFVKRKHDKDHKSISTEILPTLDEIEVM